MQEYLSKRVFEFSDNFNVSTTAYSAKSLWSLYQIGVVSLNIFDTRGSNYLLQNGKFAGTIKGATAAAWTSDGLSMTLAGANSYVLNGPAHIQPYYPNGVSNWVTYSGGYFKIQYTKDQTWTANCCRTEVTSGELPSRVPLQMLCTFKIDAGYPWDSMYYLNKTGAHTGFYQSTDTLIFQMKNGAYDGPFFSVYIGIDADGSKTLWAAAGAISAKRVILGKINVTEEVDYTIDLKFVLSSTDYPTIYGDVCGIPINYEYPYSADGSTTGAVEGATSGQAGVTKAASYAAIGIYAYNNTTLTSTLYDVEDRKLDVVGSGQTKSISVKQWTTYLLSNVPDYLKPNTPRTEKTFVASAKYPSLYNGNDTGYDPAVLPPYYGPRSWNIFDQRADNYLRGDTNWACCGIQAALAPAGYLPDCVDGVGRTEGKRPPTVGFTLSPAAYFDIGLPGGNANYYADGVPGWVDYNVAEDYFKITYSRGQHWTANCSRVQVNTPVIPTQVPFKETFTFCIPEDYPFDHIYYQRHPTYINPGPKQGLFRNRDTLIWQKKHAVSNTNGPFMSMYVTVGATTDRPYLSIGIGAPRVEKLGVDLVKGKWYTLEIYYMLGSYEFNRVYGTLDGIPFEHTFTNWACQGDAADVARLNNGPTGMCGIYSYYNSDTSTYYDVDDELPMNDPLNSPTKSLYVRRWKFEVMSNPFSLKPRLPRIARV